MQPLDDVAHRKIDQIREAVRCPIRRDELMTDAVIALPSGMTYSQRSLEEYMRTKRVVSPVGLECPLTGVPTQQIVPNLCARAIAACLA